MIQILAFELAGGIYALRTDEVERVLAAGEPLPDGWRLIDLQESLALGQSPRGPGTEGQTSLHRALLYGRGCALTIGRPLGSARIEEAWILSLPPHIFRVDRIPVAGLIDVPARRAVPAWLRQGGRGLLLDAGALAGEPAGERRMPP